MRSVNTLSAIFISLLISACSPTTTDPVRVEQDFGQSVNNMIEAQKFDPDAAERNGSKAVVGMDGQKAQDVMKTYQGAEADAASVDEPIHMNIDNN